MKPHDIGTNRTLKPIVLKIITGLLFPTDLYPYLFILPIKRHCGKYLNLLGKHFNARSHLYRKHYSETSKVYITQMACEHVCCSYTTTPPTCTLGYSQKPPGDSSSQNIHPWEREVFIILGSGTLFRDGKEYQVKAGEAMFIPPNTDHFTLNNGG